MKALIIIILFRLLQRAFTENGTCTNGPEFCPDTPYRSYDGSCNNIWAPYKGKAFRPYRRLTKNTYADGKYAFPVNMSSGKPYPSARVVSNTLFPEGTAKDKAFTIILMSLGQTITHDMSLAADTIPSVLGSPPENCCTNHTRGSQFGTNTCFAIGIPKDDYIFKKPGFSCQAFGRSGTTKKYGCMKDDVQEQISVVTSFIDLSYIYGSDNGRNQFLREFSGGRLIVEKRYNRFWPRKSPNNSLCFSQSQEEACYISGDDRVNQNPQLTIIHILFLTEHNRIANELAKINPHWDDEKLFQESRRIAIAMWQHISYNEIIPGYVGYRNMVEYGLIHPRARNCVDDYDKDADPSIMQEFATGVWRKFHTLVLEQLREYNKYKHPAGSINMSDWIDRQVLEVNATEDSTFFDRLLEGLSIQKQHKNDELYDTIMKFKFGKDASGFGLDVVSTDIQRVRDHGVGRYLDVRTYCGLFVPKDWSEMYRILPEKHVEKLKKLYDKPEDIELYSGANLEPPVRGSFGGRTAQCIMLKQFKNLRIGDRYFYENCEKHRFTNAQLNSIRKITLAKVICDNTQVKKIQKKVTREVNRRNRMVPCYELPRVDLSLWKGD